MLSDWAFPASGGGALAIRAFCSSRVPVADTNSPIAIVCGRTDPSTNLVDRPCFLSDWPCWWWLTFRSPGLLRPRIPRRPDPALSALGLFACYGLASSNASICLPAVMIAHREQAPGVGIIRAMLTVGICHSGPFRLPSACAARWGTIWPCFESGACPPLLLLALFWFAITFLPPGLSPSSLPAA